MKLHSARSTKLVPLGEFETGGGYVRLVTPGFGIGMTNDVFQIDERLQDLKTLCEVNAKNREFAIPD